VKKKKQMQGVERLRWKQKGELCQTIIMLRMWLLVTYSSLLFFLFFVRLGIKSDIFFRFGLNLLVESIGFLLILYNKMYKLLIIKFYHSIVSTLKAYKLIIWHNNFVGNLRHSLWNKMKSKIIEISGTYPNNKIYKKYS